MCTALCEGTVFDGWRCIYLTVCLQLFVTYRQCTRVLHDSDHAIHSHIMLCLVTLPTPTRQDCLVVLSVFTVWTELETSQDCRRLKISKQFCPVAKGSVNWVLSCPDPFFNSQCGHLLWRHIWKLGHEVHKCVHTADKTGQNCSVSKCWRLSQTQFTPPTRQDKTRQDGLECWLSWFSYNKWRWRNIVYWLTARRYMHVSIMKLWEYYVIMIQNNTDDKPVYVFQSHTECSRLHTTTDNGQSTTTTITLWTKRTVFQNSSSEK